MDTHSHDFHCINTIRGLSMDAIQRANSGHPGLPMGAAPMAYSLWQNHLKHNPADPSWPNRDRFVLSAGHGSMLLYSLLHLTGYPLTLDDLKTFRQLGSKTPGHPEWYHTEGVEATTGPLGQGCANTVGQAIAERMMAHRYNRPDHTVVDHYTYALVGDGDLMEGISYEAASLAGHLKLGKLIWLYDSNDISLDGPTSLSFTEDTAKRFLACGWQVLTVNDGDKDLDGLNDALTQAKADTSRPSLIIVKTTIGYGSPSKQGTEACHGAPLGDDEVKKSKEALGLDPNKNFAVPEDVKASMNATERGQAAQKDWEERFQAWKEAYPELAVEWEQAHTLTPPEGFDADLPVYKAGEKVATRKTGGDSLNALAKRIPWLVGGDADLSCSTKTLIGGESDFEGQGGSGRNIRFGVREHAMAAIANGMAYHRGLRPYVATFFSFVDYMRPSIRLAALNKLPVIYVFTHDSIGVGEDGPTHQPVEQILSLRAIPNLTVLRPGCPEEAVEAWKAVMTHTEGPVVLILSRQGLPVLDRAELAPASDLSRGAYVLSEPENHAKALLIATGSELSLAFDAHKTLAEQGIPTRVVSMPSWEWFEAQDKSYRDKVLPPAMTRRVSIEAGRTMGWSRYVGMDGECIGVDTFGQSAPGNVLFPHFGLTTQRVVDTVKSILED